MKNQYYIKSKIKISEIVLLIFGTITTVSLGIYFISIETYTFGIPILLFGLYCFYILLNYDVLYVSKNEFLIKSIMGKTKKNVPLNTFKSYTETEKENISTGPAYRKWKELTLISNNFSYNLSSTTYSNYPELRKA